MKRVLLLGLACVAVAVAGCSHGSVSSSSQRTSTAPEPASPPSAISVSASERLHPLPAWMVKRDPAAARAPGQLSRRYSLSQLRDLYEKLTRAQDAERVRIHSRFERMPATEDLEVASQRSSDEGNQIKAAQDHVYDVFRHDHRLTEDQMSVLLQVAADNHWGAT